MTLLDQIEGVHRKLLTPSGGCHNCPRGLVDFVPATLRSGPVLWLGEAPGGTEVKEQEGFTGKSGELLRRSAGEAHVPEPWSFSNVVHCRPPGNATPGEKEISCCLSQFVLDEIRGYPFVVLLGSVPLQALFPGAKADHFRGNFAHHPDFPGQRFYAMYHPAYILRRPDLENEFQRHMERLGRTVRGDREAQIEIVRGPVVVGALREMLVRPVASIDLETTVVDLWAPGFRIMSLGVSVDGERVAAAHAEDPWFLACLELVRTFLETPGKGVIGSYVAFDVECLERELEFTARVQTIHDVGIIWYEAAQYQRPSLKQLVSDQLDGYRWLVHRPETVGDVDLLLRYMAEDVAYSYRLFRRGMARLRPRTRDLVVRSLGPMALIYQRAHTHGMYVRQDYRRAKILEYAERRRAAVEAWRDEDPEFVPDDHESGNGLQEYLFARKGLPVLAKTKTDQPVVDKSVIKQWIRGGATYLRHLLTLREIDKISGTYLKAYDKHVDAWSRVHPTHWLTGTDTSRPSSSNPNVYNIPQLAEIRDLFGAPPGQVLGESDLSQIEFRIMVSLARDESGIAGYLRGDDAHTMTARTISGNPNPTKEQRTQAKPVNFGNIYGAHWKTAQAQAADDYGVYWTDEEAQRFQEDFFGTYTRIRPFHDLSRRKLIDNKGWFESVTGHVFHYRDWDHPDQATRDHTFRSALNAEAQGPAANICYVIAARARRLLDQRGFARVAIVNSVYDSIMTEIPDPAWAPAVFRTIDDAAQQAYAWVRPWFLVPLVLEHKVGESWGSLEEVKVA
jgi:uracil-DNA glycosylase family 4